MSSFWDPSSLTVHVPHRRTLASEAARPNDGQWIQLAQSLLSDGRVDHSISEHIVDCPLELAVTGRVTDDRRPCIHRQITVCPGPHNTVDIHRMAIADSRQIVVGHWLRHYPVRIAACVWEGVVPTTEDAVLVLGPEGQYEDASDAALELLGLSLEQLRELPSGALSTQSQADSKALRTAWEKAQPTAAVGQSRIRRADGTELPVAFVLHPRGDGRWEAVIHPVKNADAETKIFLTVGDVLSAWRTAERRLEALTPDSADWLAVQADIASFRAEYRVLFEAHAKRDRP